jgi:hypothetical protein
VSDRAAADCQTRWQRFGAALPTFSAIPAILPGHPATDANPQLPKIDGATQQPRSFGRKLLRRKAGIVIDAKLHYREPNTY